MRGRAVIESAKNIVWAAIFAVALWLVMVQREQTTMKADARLEVIPPSGVNVKYLPDNLNPTIEVTLRGSEIALARQRGKQVTATYKIPDATALGLKTYPVKFFTFQLEPGVDVDRSALTEEVQVDLAALTTDQLLVEPDLERALPEGWVLESVEVEPKTLEAAGPTDEMNKGYRLKTQPLSLQRILEQRDFDARSLAPQTFVVEPVGVVPPARSGITIRDRRPVRVRLRIVPKPIERDDVYIAPAFHFEGPLFAGFPYRIVPTAKSLDKVKIRVSGPELELADAGIEKTKKNFVVFVTVPVEQIVKSDAALADGSPPVLPSLEVTVIPPPGITVLEYHPKHMLFTAERPSEGE